MRLENVPLFGLTFTIYICGRITVRQIYPFYPDLKKGNIFAILIVLLVQLVVLSIIVVNLMAS